MLTFRKIENLIVGQIDGTPFSIPKTQESYDTLVALRDEDVDATTDEVMAYINVVKSGEIAGSNEYLSFKPSTGEYFLQFEGSKSKKPLPKVLVKFIEESFDKDIDFTPILKAWLRLLDNPRYNKTMAKLFSNYLNSEYIDQDEVNRLVDEEDIDRDLAVKMATYPDIAITQEGLLATYKVAQQVTFEYKMEWSKEEEKFIKVKKNILEPIVPKIDPVTGDIDKDTTNKFKDPDFKEDYVFTPAIHSNGDKFFSNNVLGYQYKVGETQMLPKEAKRNLNNTFGGGGLYIGGLKYVDGYSNSGNTTLTCLVSPADILSFQDDGKAIRVDALFVNNIWNNNVALKGKYHSSKYGKLADDRMEQMLKDATAEKETNAKKNKSN
jgi:hypothetical protein